MSGNYWEITKLSQSVKMLKNDEVNRHKNGKNGHQGGYSQSIQEMCAEEVIVGKSPNKIITSWGGGMVKK